MCDIISCAGFASVESGCPVLLLHLLPVLEPLHKQCCAQPAAPAAAAQDCQLCPLCFAATQWLPTKSLIQVSPLAC